MEACSSNSLFTGQIMTLIALWVNNHDVLVWLLQQSLNAGDDRRAMKKWSEYVKDGKGCHCPLILVKFLFLRLTPAHERCALAQTYIRWYTKLLKSPCRQKISIRSSCLLKQFGAPECITTLLGQLNFCMYMFLWYIHFILALLYITVPTVNQNIYCAIFSSAQCRGLKIAKTVHQSGGASQRSSFYLLRSERPLVWAPLCLVLIRMLGQLVYLVAQQLGHLVHLSKRQTRASVQTLKK